MAEPYLKKALTGGDSLTDVRYQYGEMMIADKWMKILQGSSNLEIDGQNYEGTKGIWFLITERKPKEYTDEDLESCKETMIKTVLYQNNGLDGGRPWRWKMEKDFTAYLEWSNQWKWYILGPT